MNAKLLYGAVCAAITPLHEDGTVDEEGVRRLCRHLNDACVPGLYPNGTNGESLSLSQAERERVARIYVEENAGKSTLYIQCGAATVAESYAHVAYAREIGADGAGLMTPVFFAADEAAMRLYFDELLDAERDIPVYAYNIPPRTGTDLSPGLLGDLMGRHENLVGVKYSYAEPAKLAEYVRCAPRRASVLVGSDALAMYCHLIGGDGWVSGPCAAFPRRHVKLYRALTGKDYARAAALEDTITQAARRMASIPEIPAIKYMLKRMGVIACDRCRRPLRPLTDAEKSTLDALQDEYLMET